MTGALNFGDCCRARCSAPARYLSQGLCMYVSAMCNDFGIDQAELPTGGEERFPLPSWDALRAADAALWFARNHLNSQEGKE